ncbi:MULTISPECIES: alpha/beta hydrolase-fold protein [unclassified Streptomyces]|uniref:alpha/beta hydrolase-fold protein n=1 Tax=unclassified Streptomyces TaxID=2593676 RepID=UPI002E800A25|nr:alpha/beta hydrolase-fold protein [Streptomyces sp. NBC_00589]WTI33887.1 alpha/beta hydrolase-fold protein [Streptomyces sp. NBC_00775]WUB32440.1 alpha/beta hydrolase-fold protein [Streptomyces sp. NBC_00589]
MSRPATRPGPAVLHTLVALATVLLLVAAGSTAHAGKRPGSAPRLSPRVVHTGTGPTGYRVTFRYKDPSATRVQIKGEWYFANPYELSALTTDDGTALETPGTPPTRWRPGDIPLAYPNSPAANWPVVDMKRGPDGMWTYTTPLPSGVFTYSFYVDCDDDTQTTCTAVSDPGNPPWNERNGKVSGTVERTSQVYVPSDPSFGTAGYAWQGPSPTGEHGTLTHVTYPAPTSVTPSGENYLSVYTPPGYDPGRAKPYPTLYLFSGDATEMDWSTQGDAGDILDNLIATGQIASMVVVMPNTAGFPDSTGYESFDRNLTDTLVPYVESHYHVSRAASGRAAAGLGYGASLTNSLLFGHTAQFGSYGVFSPGRRGNYTLPDASTLTGTQVAALEEARIYVGGGWQDPSHDYHAGEVALLTGLGVPVTPGFVNGGHNWFAWRLNLKAFLTSTAFFPPVTD